MFEVLPDGCGSDDETNAKGLLASTATRARLTRKLPSSWTGLVTGSRFRGRHRLRAASHLMHRLFQPSQPTQSFGSP